MGEEMRFICCSELVFSRQSTNSLLMSAQPKKPRVSAERPSQRRSSSRLKSADYNRRPSQRSTSSNQSVEHGKRIKEQEVRLGKFIKKCAELTAFLEGKIVQTVTSEKSLQSKFGYRLDEATEDYIKYNPVSSGNLTGYWKLVNGLRFLGSETSNLYVRVINLKKLPGDVAFRLPKTLAMGKFFGNKSTLFLSVSDIFSVLNQHVYVFQEQFSLADGLSQRAFDDEIALPQLKNWTTQLASAVEFLNLHGVAHRFVRSENVLVINSVAVKLTALDMACLFWDPEEGCLLRSPKALPLNLEPHFLNHLPPETFEEQYDPSMVDSWSIGVLLCALLTGNQNPFYVTVDEKKDLIGPNFRQWKLFPIKTRISDELRSLLDDIFKEAEDRITPFDLVSDKRLNAEMTREKFLREKLPPYYRIDLKKVSTQRVVFPFLFTNTFLFLVGCE